MAGSNGSPAQRGGQPPHWPTESDEQARALEIERWHLHQQQLAQQRGHPPAPAGGYAGHAGGVPQQPAYDPPATGYTQLHDADPHGHGGRYGHGQQPGPADYAHAAGHPPSPGQFAPQFERFAPPQHPHAHTPQRDAYGRYEPHGLDASQQPHGLPAQAHAAHGHLPELRGPFDVHRGPPQHDPRQPYAPPQHHQPYPGQPPGYAGPHDHEPRQAEARGDVQSWDLSHYQPGQIPQGYAAPGAPPDLRAPQGWPPQAPAHDPHWQQPHPGQEQWPPHDGGHPQGVQAYDGGHPGQYAPQQPGGAYDPRGGPHDPGLDPDELDPPEPPRRGPSTVLVVGMLVGAIVVGGGLAFAYKQFGVGGQDKAKVAQIKAPTTPEKFRPKDQGGKTIEHSEKKFLNRLAADAPVDSAQRQSDVDGAAKKVSTIPIVVNRDGSLSPQAQQLPPPQQQQQQQQPASAGNSGVPGLVIDGFGPPPGPVAGPPQLRGDTSQGQAAAQAASRLLPPPPPPPAARAPTQPPRVADLPLPKVMSAPVAPPQAAPATAAVERAAPPKKRPAAVRDDLLAQQGAGGAATDVAPNGLGSAVAAPPRKPVAATSSSGFVAVLASKKSRQDALNSFADLHSQYPDILSGMTPDVKEANLGDKGMWYRLIVGPPGSREAARTLCVKLKDKGMKDCWPVAY